MKRPSPIAAMPAAVAALIASSAGAASAGHYDTGASDSRIKIGQTYPYSGSGSGADSGARAMAMI